MDHELLGAEEVRDGLGHLLVALRPTDLHVERLRHLGQDGLLAGHVVEELLAGLQGVEGDGQGLVGTIEMGSNFVVVR